MNFRKNIKPIGIIFFLAFPVLRPATGHGYEIFIFRPFDKKLALDHEKKIHVHGELFGQLQFPSNFPSYNDHTGKEDRWNFGFRNFIFLTEATVFQAQLVTHDDGGQRTKFDWHFSLRQNLSRYITLVLGHDSDHDSDHTSFLNGRPFYTNRNYIGFSLPFRGQSFLIEPFSWFFHHTNQRTYLDLSGKKLKHEYGLRFGGLIGQQAKLSFQLVFQSDTIFGPGQMFIADLIFRVELTDWLELAAGSCWWKDMEESVAKNRQSFHKLIWGIAILF